MYIVERVIAIRFAWCDRLFMDCCSQEPTPRGRKLGAVYALIAATVPGARGDNALGTEFHERRVVIILTLVCVALLLLVADVAYRILVKNKSQSESKRS
jgi:hypothetical protein